MNGIYLVLIEQALGQTNKQTLLLLELLLEPKNYRHNTLVTLHIGHLAKMSVKGDEQFLGN